MVRHKTWLHKGYSLVFSLSDSGVLLSLTESGWVPKQARDPFLYFEKKREVIEDIC